MKKKLNITLALFLIVFAIACGQNNKAKYEGNDYEIVDSILRTGWYYISEQETDFKRQLDKASEDYFINPDIIIPVEQFNEIEFSENGHGQISIIIRFDKRGRESWSNATKKSIGKRLGLVINDKLVSIPQVNAQITAGVSSLYRSEYTLQELKEFVEQIEVEHKLTVKNAPSANIIYLPQPEKDGDVSIEKSLNNRRSHRQFLDDSISIDNLSQILWAAYGVTLHSDNSSFVKGGLLTAPSAGGLYPLEIYAVVGKVKGLEPGVYKYISKGHKIEKIINNDMRTELCSAALGQKSVENAPVSLIYTAVFSRTTNKYGNRGRERYVCIDLGHSAENVYLQAEALNLGTCAIGAFDDKLVIKFLNFPKDEEPLYIMPIGYYDKENGL